MSAMGITHRLYSLPFRFIYYMAFICELIYRLTGIEPLMTRLEVNLVGVTNTYSIEKAKRELNYNPINNHNLQPSVDYFRRYYNDHPIDSNLFKTLLIGISIMVVLFMAMTIF